MKLELMLANSTIQTGPFYNRLTVFLLSQKGKELKHKFFQAIHKQNKKKLKFIKLNLR
jgi:hypothetical protein